MERLGLEGRPSRSHLGPVNNILWTSLKCNTQSLYQFAIGIVDYPSCVWQVARMVTKHFQELQQRELRAEREDVMKMKRIASSVAKMVREFWCNIEKVSSAVCDSHYKLSKYSGLVVLLCISDVFRNENYEKGYFW